jgi:hypothetical protein
MEAASGPNTFGLASRIRPIFHPFVYRYKRTLSEADDRPRHRTCDLDGHGCCDRQVRGRHFRDHALVAEEAAAVIDNEVK